MRKVIYYVACSLDGFIATEQGSWDGFLTEGDHIPEYIESLKKFDAVLMGRKTYEVGTRENITNPYPAMESFVFSRTMKVSPDKHITLISEKAGQFVKELKEATGKSIYLCGGSELATTLLNEQLIDRIILKVNPFLMGNGILLFSDKVKQNPLQPTQIKKFSSGVIKLCYNVLY